MCRGWPTIQPTKMKLKEKVKSWFKKPKREEDGKFREETIWERRFKLPNWTIKTVIIAYALFGSYAVYTTIQNETKQFLTKLTTPKVIAIRADVAQAQDGDVSDQERNEDIETCNQAIDYWTQELEMEGQKDLFYRIVKAESGFKNTAKNGSSTASGCSQFVWGTWHSQGLKYWSDDFYSRNIWNPSDNVELMIRMVKDGGLSHWDASKAIWNQ